MQTYVLEGSSKLIIRERLPDLCFLLLFSCSSLAWKYTKVHRERRESPSHFFLHAQLALSICRRLSQAAFNSVQYLVQRGSYLSKPSPAWENLRVQFSIFSPPFERNYFAARLISDCSGTRGKCRLILVEKWKQASQTALWSVRLLNWFLYFLYFPNCNSLWHDSNRYSKCCSSASITVSRFAVAKTFPRRIR